MIIRIKDEAGKQPHLLIKYEIKGPDERRTAVLEDPEKM